jgi:hypothetical protein
MAFLLAIAAPASRALAWGATGHRLIGRLGVAALPANLPAFLRTPEAVETIGEYAREPDRWKGTGEPHDSERNAAHFTDVDDSGKILGGPALDALPPTRAKFEEALQKVGSNSYVAGYLPYSIIDGWQQLGKDFAYWRVLTAAIANETDPVRRAWLQRDLARREALTLPMSATAASRCMSRCISTAGAPIQTRITTPSRRCTPRLKAPSCAPMSARMMCRRR